MHQLCGLHDTHDAHCPQVTTELQIQAVQQRLWALMGRALLGDDRPSAAGRLMRQLEEQALWELMVAMREQIDTAQVQASEGEETSGTVALLQRRYQVS